jgi:hypothetical protein
MRHRYPVLDNKTVLKNLPPPPPPPTALLQDILTINVPLILKMREIIFLRANYLKVV